MARSLRSPRFPVGASGAFQRLVPIGRIVVLPGETLKGLRCTLKMQSLPLKYALMGAYFDVWWFYCPIRAGWPGFEDFILGNGGTIPTEPLAQTPYFEAGTGKPNLFSRCYAEVVNTYFREEDKMDLAGEYPPQSTAVYPMPTSDFTVEHMSRADADATDVLVPIVGDQLSVMDLRAAQAKQRWLEHRDEASSSYVNYLASFGVNSAEVATAAPEHLGKYRKFIMPSRSVDDATGATVQSYFHEMEMNLTKPRFFAEHGYLVGVMSIRIKNHHGSHGAFDSLWLTPELWPVPGQPRDLRLVNGAFGALTEPVGDVKLQKKSDYFLKYGQHLSGDVGARATATNMLYVRDAEDVDKWQYPDSVPSHVLVGGATLPGNGTFQVDGVTSCKIASPLTLDTYSRDMF